MHTRYRPMLKKGMISARLRIALKTCANRLCMLKLNSRMRRRSSANEKRKEKKRKEKKRKEKKRKDKRREEKTRKETTAPFDIISISQVVYQAAQVSQNETCLWLADRPWGRSSQCWSTLTWYFATACLPSTNKFHFDIVWTKCINPTAAESCRWDSVRMVILWQNVIKLQGKGLMACLIRPLHDISRSGGCCQFTLGKHHLCCTASSPAELQGDQKLMPVHWHNDIGFCNSMRPRIKKSTNAVCTGDFFQAVTMIFWYNDQLQGSACAEYYCTLFILSHLCKSA